jgi:hypothetical protein
VAVNAASQKKEMFALENKSSISKKPFEVKKTNGSSICCNACPRRQKVKKMTHLALKRVPQLLAGPSGRPVAALSRLNLMAPAYEIICGMFSALFTLLKKE